MITDNNIKLLKKIQEVLIESEKNVFRATDIPFLENLYIKEKIKTEYKQLNFEFTKLALIFVELNICEMTEDLQIGGTNLRINNKIYSFDFEKKYNEQKENTKLTLLKNIKIKNDAKLSKWQLIVFWPIFVIAFFGSIIGYLNFTKNQESTKNIKLLELKMKQITKELQKQRTLLLVQKRVDSSLIQKTDLNQPNK
jgi:hypothetical protein